MIIETIEIWILEIIEIITGIMIIDIMMKWNMEVIETLIIEIIEMITEQETMIDVVAK